MKSVTSIKQAQIKEQWYIVDVTGQRIGVIASKVAEILMGKNNPLMKSYHKPSNHVIIVNSEKIDFTPKRGLSKFYKSYSGFPGGLRFTSLDNSHSKNPAKPIEYAVKGMLPRTKRGDEMMANLRIYPGSEHQHEAQQPTVVNLKNFKV